MILGKCIRRIIHCPEMYLAYFLAQLQFCCYTYYLRYWLIIQNWCMTYALWIKTCKGSLFALSILLQGILLHADILTFFLVFNFFDLWYFYFYFSVSSGTHVLFFFLYLFDLFLFYFAMHSAISFLYFLAKKYCLRESG